MIINPQTDNFKFISELEFKIQNIYSKTRDIRNHIIKILYSQTKDIRNHIIKILYSQSRDIKN